MKTFLKKCLKLRMEGWIGGDWTEKGWDLMWKVAWSREE